MAFATLCLSRLFHGFSCKEDKPVIFTKRMFDNRFGLIAFAAGFLLITAVLLITPIHGFFKVESLSAGLLCTVYGLALGSMITVQIIKAVISAAKKA